MTFRKLLIVPLVISALLLIFFSSEITASYTVLSSGVVIDSTFIMTIVFACIFQFIGHIIRAQKMKFLMSPVKQGTTRFQFRALSIGYLCNVLLPLKLGELVRAKIIASGERLSFGFALTLVIIERLTDAYLLSFIGLALIAGGVLSGAAAIYTVLLLAVAIILTIFIILLGLQSQKLLKAWYVTTSIFKDPIRDKLRFKLWSVIYGIQRTVTFRRALPYCGLTLASWISYAISVYLLVKMLLPAEGLLGQFARTIAPYFGVSVPAGPASLGAFSQITDQFSSKVSMTPNETMVADLLSWGVLTLPVSILGLLLLVWKTKEPVMRYLPRGNSEDSLSEKLRRTENISPEMGNFLENYFSGHSLSRIVHRLELDNDFNLIKYFKGGSDAITILALQSKETVVKKIIPVEVAPRLKAQHDWLVKHGGKLGVVRVLREHSSKSYYAIDLEYNDRNEMFFDYMHRNSIEASKRVLDDVWSKLHRNLYRSLEKVTDYEAVNEYVEVHIFGCVKKACSASVELETAVALKKIRINGKLYLNLEQVVKKIQANPDAMRDLATYSLSKEVHGDVAVDNILVNRESRKSFLIDPAPDGNIIVGPVFDFGKTMQSLYCGYEFIMRSNDVVALDKYGAIEYYDRLSVPYRELCDYVRDELSPKYLDEGERRAMIFHAGALHIRRLKHQVYQAPGLTLALYAAGVRTLNEFLALYETGKKKR